MDDVRTCIAVDYLRRPVPCKLSPFEVRHGRGRGGASRDAGPCFRGRAGARGQALGVRGPGGDLHEPPRQQPGHGAGSQGLDSLREAHGEGGDAPR